MLVPGPGGENTCLLIPTPVSFFPNAASGFWNVPLIHPLAVPQFFHTHSKLPCFSKQLSSSAYMSAPSGSS